MSQAEPETPAAEEFITYAEWGAQFFRLAVTRDRIAAVAASLGDRTIDFGPTKLDPIGLIRVSANGKVGSPEVTPRDDVLVAFDLTIPARLALLLEIGPDKHRFDADVVIRLVVTARAAQPLSIVVDVDPPTRDDVSVEVTTDALRSSVLRIVAGIDGEVRRYVARFVAAELDEPEFQSSRTIDVAALLADLHLGV